MTITAARGIARDYVDARLRHTQGVIRRLPHVDRVGVEERAAALGKRSIKTTAKQQGIRLAVVDGRPDDARGLGHARQGAPPVREGRLPGPDACPRSPPVAAVCVYPSLVGVAREALDGTGVRASPRWPPAFPSGQASLDVKLRDTAEAVAAGAERDRHGDLARGLPGRRRHARVEEIVRGQGGVRRRPPEGDPRDRGARRPTTHVRHASMLAMEAGADFIKTSTGKAASGRHARASSLVMLEAIRDYAERTGRVGRHEGRRRRVHTARPRCTCSCWSRRRSATTG